MCHGLRAAALLAFLGIIGCSSSGDHDVAHEVIDPANIPTITIKLPMENDELARDQPVLVEGELEVGQGQWTPGVVVIEINKDKDGTINHGSYGIAPESRDVAGRYGFKAELKTPRNAGKYYVRAIGIGDPGRAAGSGDAKGRDRIYRAVSKCVEIKVKK